MSGLTQKVFFAQDRLQTAQGSSDLPPLPHTQRLQNPRVTETMVTMVQVGAVSTWPGTGSARFLPGPATSTARRRSQPGPYSAGRQARAARARAEGRRPGPAHESVLELIRLYHFSYTLCDSIYIYICSATSLYWLQGFSIDIWGSGPWALKLRSTSLPTSATNAAPLLSPTGSTCTLAPSTSKTTETLRRRGSPMILRIQLLGAGFLLRAGILRLREGHLTLNPKP